MENIQESSRNSFGRCFEQLLSISNIKNATVASALNYDVSYISKWITGKALPSKKHIQNILSVVSDLVCAQPTQELLRRFDTTDDDVLRELVSRYLLDAYYEATGTRFQEQHINNAVLRSEPRGTLALLEDLSAALLPGTPRNIAVLADLFSMDHISKLRLAGIESQHFRMRKKQEDLNIDYVIDLSSLDGNSAYDVILLIHMMTSFSMCNYRLYHSHVASGKLLISVQREFAGVTLLSNDHQFLCTTATQDKATAGAIYDTIHGLIDPDQLLFSSQDMEHLLQNREYFHNLFSQNNRWLVGHVTEHFLPPELFHQLMETYFGSDPALSEEAKRVHLLTTSLFSKNKVQIILYYLALSEFMLSGELDFFNHKVILSKNQRLKVLLHIKQLIQELTPDTVKLVREGFNDDFKYITNPCIFLSNATSYLRLENRIYRDNILLIKNETLRHIFETFFEKIWNDCPEVMITDYTEIVESLDNLVEAAYLLP